MKFLSVDLETTGLDPKLHGVVEFAAILADTNDSLPLETFHLWINPEGMVWTNYCLNLHKALLEKLIPRCLKKEWEVQGQPTIAQNYQNALGLFKMWLDMIGWSATAQSVNGSVKFTAAGKNFGSFDLQFIQQAMQWPPMFRHRALDPGSMFVNGLDKELPDLTTCKKRAAADGCKFTQPEVLHEALADAYDVVKLIQHYFNSPHD